MSEDADDFKVKIVKTRDAIAETLDQVTSSATDSVALAQDRITDVAHEAQSKIGEALDAAGSRVRSLQDVTLEKLPLTQTLRKSSPLLFLLGAAAVAFAAGYIVPLSAIEKEQLSSLGEDLARRVGEARDEVVSQGSAVVNDTITAAKTSLKEHGEEAAAFLGVSLPEMAPVDSVA